MKKILKSYFYWTYSRGSLHYDVMVTLILAFIFITPRMWDYGDKPTIPSVPLHPMEVTTDGSHSLIVTVQASDVQVPTSASNAEARKILRKAVEPVAGDAIYVERWELVRDAGGSPLAWKVWAHR